MRKESESRNPRGDKSLVDIQAVSAEAVNERLVMDILEPTSNQKGKALLDTGAQVDCLDRKFVQKLGKLDQIEAFRTKKYATSFNGKRTEILGVLNLTLQFPNLKYNNVNWYVIDLDGKFNAILGTPFFNHHGLTRTMHQQVELVTGQKPNFEANF